MLESTDMVTWDGWVGHMRHTSSGLGGGPDITIQYHGFERNHLVPRLLITERWEIYSQGWEGWASPYRMGIDIRTFLTNKSRDILRENMQFSLHGRVARLFPPVSSYYTCVDARFTDYHKLNASFVPFRL